VSRRDIIVREMANPKHLAILVLDGVDLPDTSARCSARTSTASSSTGWGHPRKPDVTAKAVGDFTRWKDHDRYMRSLDRLLRDLHEIRGM
jgi:hypothetical protein